jgi:uncharacterized protein (DUF1015 family)
VTEVHPFRASVVRPEWAPRVVSPMHDSLTPVERAKIKAANPDSFLHVTRRAGDPDESEDPAVAAAEGNASLDRLLAADAFLDLADLSIFVDRIDSEGSAHVGIVAEVPVGAFERGDVRGHEDVQPDRVEALSLYLEGVGGSSDPVALMFHPDPEISKMLTEIENEEPILRIDHDPEAVQTVWHVVDPDAQRTIAARLAPEILYVADGHHRVAAAVAASKRMADPSSAAVLCVLYPADELRVLAFHRLVTKPVVWSDAARGLEDRFSLRETPGPEPAHGSFAIRANGRWLRADPLEKVRLPGVAGLDVTRLHDELLPALGIEDVNDPGLEFLPDTVPVQELEARADDSGGALLLLAAPSVDELFEVADRGEIVPPKSTYFVPKPMSGVFLRTSGAGVEKTN